MWEKFYKKNPYDDFPLERYQGDIQGWGAHPIFLEVIQKIRPQTIIEVGTWKGFTALYMARLMELSNLNGHILCIDTWLGSAEHFFSQDPMTILKRKNGFPEIYEQFLANVLFQKRQNVIVPLPQTSDAAFEILSKIKFTADVIYIDGAHDYETVSRDLRNYWSLISSGGVLFGDDYEWPGVRQAVDEFTGRMKLKCFVIGEKYLFEKRPQSPLKSQQNKG